MSTSQILKDPSRHQEYVNLTIERDRHTEDLASEKNKFRQVKKQWKTFKRGKKTKIQEIDSKLEEILKAETC